MLEFPLGRTPSVEFDDLLGWNAIRELRITLDNDRGVLVFEPPRHEATSRSEFAWVGKPFVRARARNGLPVALYLGSDALTSGRVVIDFQAGEFSISGAR